VRAFKSATLGMAPVTGLPSHDLVSTGTLKYEEVAPCRPEQSHRPPYGQEYDTFGLGAGKKIRALEVRRCCVRSERLTPPLCVEATLVQTQDYLAEMEMTEGARAHALSTRIAKLEASPLS
jgi:hypothetical protein